MVFTKAIVFYSASVVDTFAKKVMLFVDWFVRLSAGLRKKHMPDFHETWWKGVAWAEEEPLIFWSGCKSTNCSSLSLKNTRKDIWPWQKSATLLVLLLVTVCASAPSYCDISKTF